MNPLSATPYIGREQRKKKASDCFLPPECTLGTTTEAIASFEIVEGTKGDETRWRCRGYVQHCEAAQDQGPDKAYFIQKSTLHECFGFHSLLQCQMFLAGPRGGASLIFVLIALNSRSRQLWVFIKAKLAVTFQQNGTEIIPLHQLLINSRGLSDFLQSLH